MQTRDILVVDLDDVIDTECAHLAPACIAPTATEATATEPWPIAAIPITIAKA